MRLALIAIAIITASGSSPLVAEPAGPSEQDRWAAPPASWEGVWQGTIGTLPIHICLNNTPYMNQGAYYYDAHKTLIRLDLSEDGKEWLEGDLDENTRAQLNNARE